MRPKFLIAAFMTAASISMSSLAHAATVQPFTNAAFDAAQKADKPIVIDAYADWCPVCHLQAVTLEKIEHDKAFNNLVILRIDYDHQDEAKRRLGVNHQSTLIAFHGTVETARMVGVVDAAQITALAQSAQSGRAFSK